MWLPTPLKERWCPHHVIRFFFAGLVWNFFMAFWAHSMSDSFTQDSSIGWYPLHLTKNSRSQPLSYLDLNTTSISNSGSLWTKFGGGLELCSRLGLEASRAIDFKRETWNVGWTLRFSGSFNLLVLESFFSNTLNGPTYGPKNLWFKPFSNRKFLMFYHTSSPSWNFISCRDSFAKFLYRLCAFSKLAFTNSHRRHLSSSSCVTIGTSSLASLEGYSCATQVMGTIGDLPVTIWKGVDPVMECFELL